MFIVMNSGGEYLNVSKVSSHSSRNEYEYVWNTLENASTFINKRDFGDFSSNLKSQAPLDIDKLIKLKVSVETIRNITILGVIE